MISCLYSNISVINILNFYEVFLWGYQSISQLLTKVLFGNLYLYK